MSTRSSTRLNRGVVVGLTASLTALGVTAVAPAASAATGPVSYVCVPSGPVVVDTDSDAPAKMFVGDTFTPTITTVFTLPELERALRYGAGARSVDGVVEAKGDVNGTPVTPYELTVTPRDVPEAGALPITAVGKGAPLVATAPGDLEIHAGDFTATLTYRDAAGDPLLLPADPYVCPASPGQPPTIDKVVVASRSSTALTLSTTTSSYGETVTASATVTTPGGSPDGSVNVVVDGVARKASHIAKDGTASMDLGTLATGDHTVSAAFVPKDAVHYVASTSAPQTLTVRKAATRIRLAITGKRTDRATRATAKVKAAFGTEATGKVKFVLRKLTRGTKKWVKVRRLSGGQFSAGFGKLKKARYKLVVKYRGDSNHLRSTKIKKFRVKRAR